MPTLKSHRLFASIVTQGFSFRINKPCMLHRDPKVALGALDGSWHHAIATIVPQTLGTLVVCLSLTTEETLVTVGMCNKGIIHAAFLPHPGSVPVIRVRRAAFQTNRRHGLHVILTVSFPTLCTSRGGGPLTPSDSTNLVATGAPNASITLASLQDCVLFKGALTSRPFNSRLLAV